MKTIQMHYFCCLTSATEWNRAPDDPAAALKVPPSPGLAAQLDATKTTTDYEPYLARTMSEQRFRELLLKPRKRQQQALPDSATRLSPSVAPPSRRPSVA